MSCPRCGSVLENYSSQEGGWCPMCGEWFPADIVEEGLDEEDPYDDYAERDYHEWMDDEDEF